MSAERWAEYETKWERADERFANDEITYNEYAAVFGFPSTPDGDVVKSKHRLWGGSSNQSPSKKRGRRKMSKKKPITIVMPPVSQKGLDKLAAILKKRTKPVGKSGEPFKSGGYTPTSTSEEKGKK